LVERKKVDCAPYVMEAYWNPDTVMISVHVDEQYRCEYAVDVTENSDYRSLVLY